jgi:hypothetical protein
MRHLEVLVVLDAPQVRLEQDAFDCVKADEVGEQQPVRQCGHNQAFLPVFHQVPAVVSGLRMQLEW